VQDLIGVVLARSADKFRVTWTTRRAAPASGTALWSLFVGSADGSESRQLGLKILDGRVIGHFVFDVRTAQQQNVNTARAPTGVNAIAEFPIEAVDSLGEGAHWAAGVNADGNDSDACPDVGPDPLNPQTLPLPSA
jgi:hypothetical protein